MILPLTTGLLFSPKDRGMLEEVHPPITESYGHRKSRNVPEWVPGMTLYEVFVRTYSEDGNLKSLVRDLPRLKDLGVKTIWLMPIHPIGQRGRKGTFGSPYSIQDFFSIAPELGNADDFRELVDAVHKLDMKILIDLVANHTANDHVEMKKHPDWFKRDGQGTCTRRIARWSDVTDLDYDNPELWSYMKKVILHWVEVFDIDGYRCDSAALVPLQFWQEVRNDLEGIKRDIFLLAEGDHPEMHLHAFDATYDWDLYFALEDIKVGKARAEDALNVILKAEALFPQNALRLRFIENHDLERSMKLFGDATSKPYAALIFTIPGIPLIYNGQEIGSKIRPNIFEKDDINWSEVDSEVLSFYKYLINLRQNRSQFHEGRIIKIDTDDSKNLLAYARIKDEKVGVVVLNFSEKRIKTKLHFPTELQANLLRRNPELTLAPHDVRIFLDT